MCLFPEGDFWKAFAAKPEGPLMSGLEKSILQFVGLEIRYFVNRLKFFILFTVLLGKFHHNIQFHHTGLFVE